MKIFGFEITKAMQAVDTRRGWFSLIAEAWNGAWQANIKADRTEDVVAFSGVFACTTKIAGDVAKMRPKVVMDNDDGTCTEVKGQTPFRAVLEKPNHYQNRIKFFQQWIACKLIWGNTYAFKKRDNRGLVRNLYLLDPQRVTPLVADDGSVYYRLAGDNLAGLEAVTVPASEIIHDLMVPLWHPLVGVSPLYSCGVSATMGNRIQKNSTSFFQNMSRAGGYLMSPGKLDPTEAAQLKRDWEANFSGANAGRTAVLANGLTFQDAKTMPAEQAQLIQQLGWTVEDVARCFHMPTYKVGGAIPANTSVEALNQAYYSECLQVLIEDLELALKEGLALPDNYYVEFDLDGLLRMDQSAMADVEVKLAGAGINKPNESRLRFNRPPVPGGDTPYLQQQYWGLKQLSERKAAPDGKPMTEKPQEKPAANAEEYAAALTDRIEKRVEKAVREELAVERAERAAKEADELTQAEALADFFVRELNAA